MSDAPVRIGIVGAGPWAKMVYAPLISAGPDTALSGVWARRPEAAADLASRSGAPSHSGDGGLHALAATSDALVFAVPPSVQADLAVRCLDNGIPLFLEKPIAGDLAAAERLAAAVADAGVATMVTLSWRYAESVRAFLAACAAGRPTIGQARFVSGALLGASPFATPWRLGEGPLLDLGPHVLDLLGAALGPIDSINATGDRLGTVSLCLTHEGGAASQAVLSATTPISASWSGAEVIVEGDSGATIERIDTNAAVGIDAFLTWRSEAASLVRNGPTPTTLDVHHGLRLQRLLAQASDQLG